MMSNQFCQLISFMVILSSAIDVSSFNTRVSCRTNVGKFDHSTPRTNHHLYASSKPAITTLKSDIFQDPKNSKSNDGDDLLKEIVGYLPPPPEDQFIMTGDIAVLFLYSFVGHAVDDYVVKSVFESSQSTQQAIQTLDPMQEVVRMQTPVWIDHSTPPYMVDQIISMNAK